MLISFVVGLIAFGIHAVLVPILLRLLKIRPIIVHIISSLSVNIGVTIASALSVDTMSYWQEAALYWFCVWIYYYGFVSFNKSISTMMVYNLSSWTGRSANHPKLYKTCIKQNFIRRTEIMVGNGLVKRRNDKYFVTPDGKKLATIIRFLQRQLGIKRNGIYFAPQDVYKNRGNEPPALSREVGS